MHKPNQPERFHALDAIRAFALLLGVVFHAAWSFAATPLGAPLVDPNGSIVFDWFFFTSHTFRMQLFFLIAGFFAHMVCHRRGFLVFARNRLTRIGVPMVVGWVVFYPLVAMAFTAGGNVSGRNLTEVSLMDTFSGLYLKGLMFVPKSAGGMFGMAHFWFLYYLLLIYVLALGFRFVLTRSNCVANSLRERADGAARRVMQSPWCILPLAMGMGLFLWPMHGWFGVDTPLGTLTPSIPVLMLYGFFFAFGWLLHRQAHLLKELLRHWRWQLMLGLALSIPLFGLYKSLRDSGATGSMSNKYPTLTSSQVTNWPAFLERLQSAADPGRAPAELANAWAHLRPNVQPQILSATADASFDQRVGMVKTLGKLLTQPALFDTDAIQSKVALSSSETGRVLLENRVELERLFAGSLAGDPSKVRWYHQMKLAYSVGYGLVMWLFLFGTLGVFEAQCNGHSPAWRYVADSSYWVYLAHLPLVAALQVWLAGWSWPGFAKFALLLVIAFSLLFASYHLLVRSTFVGRTLNGRAYPFHWNPWRALRPESSHADAPADGNVRLPNPSCQQ